MAGSSMVLEEVILRSKSVPVLAFDVDYTRVRTPVKLGPRGPTQSLPDHNTSLLCMSLAESHSGNCHLWNNISWEEHRFYTLCNQGQRFSVVCAHRRRVPYKFRYRKLCGYEFSGPGTAVPALGVS